MHSFLWAVSASGYRWVTADESDAHSIREVDRLVVVDTSGVRRYDPSSHTDLHLKFADLDPTLEACLKFANQFGHLTAGVGLPEPNGAAADKEYEEPLRWPNGAPPRQGFGGHRTYTRTEIEPESFELWRHHVGHMKGVVASLTVGVDVGDGVPGHAYRQQVVQTLEHRVRPGFDDQGRLVHVPTDLLAFLWLQQAGDVGSSVNYRRCPTCKLLFKISPADPSGGGRRGRSDKQFCKEQCRTRAFYDRKVAQQATDNAQNGGKP